jgi:hypothetical protein
VKRQVLRTAFYVLLVAAAVAVTWDATVGARRSATAPPKSAAQELQCDLRARLAMLGKLPEASGLALSRRTAGVVWSMDDSDDPAVLGFTPDGTERGAVRITGATVRDWEDISIGPCPHGSCLYVGDIGDDGVKRMQVTVYRVPEPDLDESATPAAETFLFNYPDTGHDAEALFVAPDGTLFIITKGHPTLLYRAPRDARPGVAATLTRVAELPVEDLLVDHDRRRSRITDAETSPDGKWVALRTNSELLLFPTGEITNGRTAQVWHADLRSLDETQGEGVALSNDGDVYLAGEGGGHGLPGTLTRVTCMLPQ